MGKKKPKDDEISAPSSIFTALFGGIRDETAVASSIFSDSNPFKRKHEELEAGNETIVNSKNSDTLNSDIAELKKRKKNRNEKSNLDSDFAEGEEATNKNPNLSSESDGTSENEKGEKHGSTLDSKVDFNEEKKNPNLDIEGKEGSEKRKRKKRKRDDVEREYEEKKYGVKAEEEKEKKEVVGKVVVGEKRKQSDKETEDMLIHSKEEGFDDESKLLRTVFVGNLPVKVKKKALMKEFSNFGEIESVRIRSVPILDTKTPRKGAILKKQINDNVDSVHAYIVFKSEQAAEASLNHNMAVVGGNHIRVDRACPPRKKLKGENAPLYDNKRTVFVGNLPFDVKDEEIYQLFCGLNNLESSVEAVRVIRHSHMRVGKGIAYVLFKTREAANSVVKKRNLKLRDRELRLSHAGQNSTPSKRKSAAPASASNSPAKKFSVDSKSPGSANQSYSKGAMSYQGLQASKSGVQKKAHSGSTGPVRMKSKTQKGEKPKVRLEKRQSVALRKARAKVLKDGIATKQAGTKRKLDSRTPESSLRKKKTKRFR